MQQMTEDQTLGRQLMKIGYPEEGVEKYHRILANWFGTGIHESPDVEIRHIQLKVGDRLLLCSDGLNKELSHQEIETLLGESGTVQEICDRLLESALAKGGHDNVTIIVAEATDPES